jgi:hypothetical protein
VKPLSAPRLLIDRPLHGVGSPLVVVATAFAQLVDDLRACRRRTVLRQLELRTAARDLEADRGGRW